VIVRVWIVVPGEVKIAVADNGVGLPADRTAQIFEPFYTTKAGRRRNRVVQPSDLSRYLIV